MQIPVTRIQVRYAETDQMGVVYHANYLIWMEVARVDYCKAIGFRYKDMEERDGILLAVIEAHGRYLSPARYDDEVEVETVLSESNQRFVAFEYEMRVGGRKVFSGKTRHMWLDKQMRPVRLPARYCSLFGTK